MGKHKKKSAEEIKAERAARAAGCRAQYFIAQYGEPEEYPSLEALLTDWMEAYIHGSCSAYILFTEQDGKQWEVPIPLVDDHDYERNHQGVPSVELAMMKAGALFWKEAGMDARGAEGAA